MHSATHADIMTLPSLPAYDLLYTDPPWGQGMATWFQNKAKKDTGKLHQAHSIDALIAKLGSLADAAKPLFVEYSVKHCDAAKHTLEAAGHQHKQTAVQTQSNGKPYVLMTFNTTVVMPENKEGFDVIPLVVALTKARVVVDPFAGIGQTARAVFASGATYHGYELNRVRFNKLQRAVNVANSRN